MTQTITGLYDTYDKASAAVSALEASGVPHSEISIVANNGDNHHAMGTNDATKDAGRGAEIGTAVGGIGGLLTGLGLMAIPGVGPVVAAGWLVATITGAGVGAAVGGATGGLVGSMTAAGIPENDAHVYAEGIRRGGTLVTARVDDERAVAAKAILDSNQAIDPTKRGDTYRADGWSTFDNAAKPYSATQVADERTRLGSSAL